MNFSNRSRLVTRALLLTLAVSFIGITAPGCGESPVGNDQPGTNQQNNNQNNNNNGQPSGAVNNFTIDGDGYSDTEFACNGVFANVSYGTAIVSFSGIYDGQPATLAFGIEPAATGTHRLNYLNFIKVTIAKGVPRYYVSSNGTITITDVGTKSGVIKGSYNATLLREDTGARVTVRGTFEVPRT